MGCTGNCKASQLVLFFIVIHRSGLCHHRVHGDLLILAFVSVPLLSSGCTLRASKEEVEVEVSIAMFA